MSRGTHPVIYSSAGYENMLRRHCTLLIALLFVIVGMFACCIYFENYYTSREASAKRQI